MNWSANGYRLPTEAEWEYAARAGSTMEYYWGTSTSDWTVSQYEWYSYNSSEKTHGVGQKQPNEFGLYDIAGNVMEWCWDWFGTYLSASQTDPVGPSSGSYRVVRCCHWGSALVSLRSVGGHNGYLGNRTYTLGFRVVTKSGF